MLEIRSNVPLKDAIPMHQGHHSLGIDAIIARILRCIAYIVSSKVIVICPFTGYM